MTHFESLCNEYRENKRLIEDLEAMNAAVKAEILEIMGDADTMTAGSAKATNKTVTSYRLDASAIKANYPEIYDSYVKTMTYSRFTVH